MNPTHGPPHLSLRATLSVTKADKDKTDRERTEKADKRTRILEGALQVFARKGFFSARIADVADAAGVADGTIYLYFKNKDDLLISLFEDRMSWLIRRLSAELEQTQDLIEQIRRYIHMHLSLVDVSPDLATFITIELRQSSRFIREYANPHFSEYLRILQSLIKRGQDAGVIRSHLDPRLAARAIFGAMDELLLTAALTRHRAPDATDDWSRQAAELLLGGVLTPPPSPPDSGDTP
jgi:TetR/AcrR family transcriptional regulator, fatty acid metabolism regulator protein